ncbi:hypothetical protein WICPIJ_004135 [Wickerhamomyces pijperi]|uniref:Uncharacterized protein n=1 Tax=Wickerhamomyces pijperi TaxID=599730 RepID=A0A9P8Q6I1_WICPI|nr:hypothetical protein WICPIJ_004135 [Wickerhamomyces pijperi]
MMVFSCSSSTKVVLDLMVSTNLSSSVSKYLAKVAFQDCLVVKISVSSSFNKPKSTRTLMNCGNPSNLKVPLMTVSASGILYKSLKAVESLFG